VKSPLFNSLQDLKTLQRELQLRQREQQERLVREAAQARLRDQERRLFELSIGPVTTLPDKGLVQHARNKPEAEPLQRELDEREALRQALSDDFDVDSLLETDETLSFRRSEIGPDVVRKLRRGHWTLQAQIDLHGLRRDQAREALGGFIQDSARRACAAFVWCMARVMVRPAANPCSRAVCGVGWCKSRRCWPSCRRAPAMAAAAH